MSEANFLLKKENLKSWVLLSAIGNRDQIQVIRFAVGSAFTCRDILPALEFYNSKSVWSTDDKVDSVDRNFFYRLLFRIYLTREI